MYTLLIETSTERGVIAILQNGTLLMQAKLPFGYNNSKHLLPTIQNTLLQCNLAIKDFGLIIAGIGPGSYTGMRIGAMTAKTLSYACRIPLVGVPSLMGFCPSRPGRFAALIDAKIGGAYMQKGIAESGAIRFLESPALLPLEALESHLKEVEIIVTPYSGILREKLHALIPNASWEWEEKDPDVHQLAYEGLRLYGNGNFSKDGSLELLYLRKTQAEIELGEKLKDVKDLK